MYKVLLAQTCSSLSVKAQFSITVANDKQTDTTEGRKGSRVQREAYHRYTNCTLERPQVAKRGIRMAQSCWGEKDWALKRNPELIKTDKRYENTMCGSKHHCNACDQMQRAGFVAYVNHVDDFNRAVLIYVSGGSAHIRTITALCAYWPFFFSPHPRPPV